MRPWIALALVGCTTAGCLSELIPEHAHDPAALEGDPLGMLPRGEAQRKLFCTDPGHDTVSKMMCATPPPVIRSLADLQRLLGVGFDGPTPPGVAITAHSSSLVARHISSANPRAIVFMPPRADGTPTPGHVALAFARGEQFVEVTSHDPDADEINLYLFRFTQACNAQPGGCTPADLLTDRIERDWLEVTVYEEELDNTIMDCRSCHQPDGDGKAKILRLQEHSAPFTHFLSSASAGGKALLADYRLVHGDEGYGPVPAAFIDKSDPALFARFVDANNAGAPQPNEFPSQMVETEVAASSPGQPADNTKPGKSATWQALFDRAVRGEAIPPPYHDVKVTDPQKLARAAAAYRAAVAGRPAQMVDIRDVFLDAAAVDLSFVPRPGLDGRGLLTQLCHRCHNPKLDQTLSRARFDVEKLDALPAAEKKLAIDRIRLPDGDPLHMPPARFVTVSDAERAAMIDALGR